MLAASEGRRWSANLEASSRPLDRITVALGVQSGLGIPLTAAEAVVGALIVLWDSERPPVTNQRALVIGEEAELVKELLSGDRPEPRVLVCHEEPLIASGLARVVEQQLGARIIVSSTLASALSAMSETKPDLIVCSDHLQLGERLADVARRLRAKGSAPLLILARTDSSTNCESALKAGASGYLALAAAAERLAATASDLLDGRSVFSERPSAQIGPYLTDRETDVLHCFEQGLADKEIARRLGVALSTVKTHARAVYGKLGVTSRTAAVYAARRDGLL